jgi:DNA-binding NarL/FixJ family response regulator
MSLRERSIVNDRLGPMSPAAREVARVLRDAVDADTERGLALLASDRRVLYINSAARTLLSDGSPRGVDALLPLDLDRAAQALLKRARAQQAPQALELSWPNEEERSARVLLEAMRRDLGWYVLVRLARAQAWVEPTIRRLQARFQFTLREAQVAALVARGQSNGEVATALGIVEKTVKNALMTVYQKCAVRNRVELALRAYDVGLVTREV